MQYESFNERYHTLRNDIDPNSLFSTFNLMKKLSTPAATGKYDSRPPYPIIIGNPSVGDVFYNLNKSDMLVMFTFTACGFISSLLITKRQVMLERKFLMMKHLMWWYTVTGLFVAMNASYYRLIGQFENGLRWRTKDMLASKYDITSEFERNTIFKHFRVRLD